MPDPARADPLAGVEAKLRQAPSFFEDAPLVLDLQDQGDVKVAENYGTFTLTIAGAQ